MPASKIAAMKSVVAMGRRINVREGLMRLRAQSA
jgi:hypothetical protein